MCVGRCRAFLAKHGLSFGFVGVLLLSVVLGLYLPYVFAGGKCNMAAKLLVRKQTLTPAACTVRLHRGTPPLLSTATKHLNTVRGTEGYWLDYGTLLGAVRGEGIIPFEFDLDMGVLEHDCPKYLALKDKLKEDGLIMYKKGDWVPGKENLLLGYDGYLHKACARIYSSDHEVYIDFDWNRRLSFEDAQAEHAAAKAAGHTFELPPGYTAADGDLLCNLEAWEEESSGGCRLANQVFPLQQTSVHGLQVPIVHKPNDMLTAMYGPDWRTPRPKGYKAFVCVWMPLSTPAFLLVWVLIVATPFALYKLVPLAIEHAKAYFARRNMLQQYSVLPLTKRSGRLL